MDDLKTARALRDAADYLRERGWRKGIYFDEGGACVAGAIYLTSGVGAIVGEGLDGCQHLYLENEMESWQSISTALGLEGFIRNAIFEWNDTPDRTLDEVLDRLESAALNLEIRALAASAEKNAAPREEVVAVAS